MIRTPASPTRRPLPGLLLLPLLGLALPASTAAQSAERYEGPIIDVHMHAYTDEDYWGAVPHPATGEPAPATAGEHRTATLAVMDEHGVVLGAVSGDALAAAEAWAERAPDRFLTGIAVHDPVEDLDADEFAGWVEDGRLEVFAEIGVLGHVPEHRATETLERFLRGAKARGYLDRVMFGSDQMVWPEAIAASIEAVQSLDFLTAEEKKAILYDNAARFLELSEKEIERHGAP